MLLLVVQVVALHSNRGLLLARRKELTSHVHHRFGQSVAHRCAHAFGGGFGSSVRLIGDAKIVHELGQRKRAIPIIDAFTLHCAFAVDTPRDRPRAGREVVGAARILRGAIELRQQRGAAYLGERHPLAEQCFLLSHVGPMLARQGQRIIQSKQVCRRRIRHHHPASKPPPHGL